MLFTSILLLLSAVFSSVTNEEDSGSASDYGASLLASMKTDANLDLPEDKEYEELRADLFAYRSALDSLKNSRRSMLTTPCWKRGGICISYKLCPGYRQLTEVPGCKNRHNLCCFVWNQYEIRELKDHGIGNLAFPWRIMNEFGGKGVVQETTTSKPKKNKKKKINKNNQSDGQRETVKLKKDKKKKLRIILPDLS